MAPLPMGTAKPKPRPRVLDKIQQIRDKQRQLREVQAVVKKRDQGKCRACHRPAHHAHHVIYRSHGGRDEAANLVLVCATCHKLIHAHVLLATFDPARPAATVKFTRNTAWD